MPSLEGKEN